MTSPRFIARMRAWIAGPSLPFELRIVLAGQQPVIMARCRDMATARVLFEAAKHYPFTVPAAVEIGHTNGDAIRLLIIGPQTLPVLAPDTSHDQAPERIPTILTANGEVPVDVVRHTLFAGPMPASFTTTQ